MLVTYDHIMSTGKQFYMYIQVSFQNTLLANTVTAYNIAFASCVQKGN